MRIGLATATPEHISVGDNRCEIPMLLRITEAGRKALGAK
jgi:hypothetical protein